MRNGRWTRWMRRACAWLKRDHGKAKVFSNSSLVTAIMQRKPSDTSGIGKIIIVLAVVVVVLLVAVAVLFLPLRGVSVNQSKTVTIAADIQKVNLTMVASLGQVNVRFVDSNSVTLNVTGEGRVSALSSDTPVTVSLVSSAQGNVLNVNGQVKVDTWGSGFTFNDLQCQLSLPRSMRNAVNVEAAVGEISLSTVSGLVLDSLRLKTTNGAVTASLVDGTVLNGSVSLTATNGASVLLWQDVEVRKDLSVGVTTNNGAVDISVAQNLTLEGNVTLGASATNGGLRLGMELSGANAARIASHSNLGGMTVESRQNFTGPDSELLSANYPSVHGFAATLSTNTGGITVQAAYSA